ncbi:tRNA uridine-5-carboxymethylaminomethyl(34) synthesis GTPase MnmE [Octadecabacter sp.]|nr:tRNA uridine-5-carboxymethylaminomethyl(34) synthesis GTPase MnmE [Octadecabacter sp.]
MDTIFALASAAGKAGVAVVRISGPSALETCAELGAVMRDHDRRLVRLLDQNGELIDEAFVISFAEGRSFTGEQVVELQTHGSPAIVSAVLRRLEELGLRPADAGEFTRRALDNGKLDLARVEGLADLIDAETDSQRRQAVRVFNGALGELTDRWRQKLLRAAALLEATIDFVDEDVPVDVYPEVRELVSEVRAEVYHEASGVKVRERVRDGFEVAFVGPPNSGKSTLLNRLAGRDAALTSDIAGTTRDVIEVKMDLGGLPVTMLDTAGIRESSDFLEGLGIERGKKRAEMADVRVHLLDTHVNLKPLSEFGFDIYVLAKADLRDDNPILAVSGQNGMGVDELLNQISGYLERQVASAGMATRSRHERALTSAMMALDIVSAGLNATDTPADLLAEDLRLSIRDLDSLIGRVDVESVLGEIFSSFCIGK